MTSYGASWDDVFGDLDVRVLDHDQRLDWINKRIHQTLRGKDWAVLSVGEEGRLAWDAAVQTFLEGIWVACIFFSCHVVCEREIAGALAMLPDGVKSKSWESFGLGRLLGEVTKHRLLPLDLIKDVQRIADSRKPYGHWRSAAHGESLMQRVRVEHEETGNADWANLTQRSVVRDATLAMDTTIRLYFGSYGLGGP
ncbi:Uncharacterised protein [Mycobacteroides abscessus subsp. bolletii]|uniref:hypothetical protein n=1 Tax=Mycobacteroides abscessus TaxID=36809 RepID=UPI00092B85D1|nr:hypothetical protein [Mycobacteroides abscessus]SIJ41150.1 Uncharacterised protein [Mycobacteroides abscessus subsp. bolletii]SLD51463.1 Uncharacterised protein [Mycobacteroides abscessus subsp. bolletii]SLE28652.1 Uncharacterised protein [Mycobacteroides abscessus subsp. bolletii]